MTKCAPGPSGALLGLRTLHPDRVSGTGEGGAMSRSQSAAIAAFVLVLLTFAVLVWKG